MIIINKIINKILINKLINRNNFIIEKISNKFKLIMII